MNVTFSTEFLSSGGRLRTPAYAPIETAAMGNNLLVAAAPGRSILVLGYTLVAANAVAVRFVSGAAMNLTGPMELAANGVIEAGSMPTGHLRSAPGQALSLNLSAAVAVAGHMTYVLVD